MCMHALRYYTVHVLINNPVTICGQTETRCLKLSRFHCHNNIYKYMEIALSLHGRYTKKIYYSKVE